MTKNQKIALSLVLFMVLWAVQNLTDNPNEPEQMSPVVAQIIGLGLIGAIVRRVYVNHIASALASKKHQLDLALIAYKQALSNAHDQLTTKPVKVSNNRLHTVKISRVNAVKPITLNDINKR